MYLGCQSWCLSLPQHGYDLLKAFIWNTFTEKKSAWREHAVIHKYRLKCWKYCQNHSNWVMGALCSMSIWKNKIPNLWKHMIKIKFNNVIQSPVLWVSNHVDSNCKFDWSGAFINLWAASVYKPFAFQQAHNEFTLQKLSPISRWMSFPTNPRHVLNPRTFAGNERLSTRFGKVNWCAFERRSGSYRICPY